MRRPRRSWKASVSRGSRLSLGFALTVGAALASALEYAHSSCSCDGTPLEIVHRDVSLSNVIVGRDGSVKLIDFGIARAATRTTRTQVGALKGKIGYLAPEQILHLPIDRRTDIFALGIVLYELTTTTRAFCDASDLLTFERVTRGALVPPSEIVAGYPLDLERVVVRALEIDPSKRFQNAGSLARALEDVAESLALRLGHGCVTGAIDQLFPSSRRRLTRAHTETTDVTAPLNLGAETVVEMTDAVVEIEDTPTRRFP